MNEYYLYSSNPVGLRYSECHADKHLKETIPYIREDPESHRKKRIIDLLSKIFKDISSQQKAFETETKDYITDIISKANHVISFFDSTLMEIQKITKRICMSYSNDLKDSYFVNILDLSDSSFEKELDKIKQLKYFDIKVNKYPNLNQFSVYENELIKLSDNLNSLKVSQDLNKNSIYFVSFYKGNNFLCKIGVEDLQCSVEKIALGETTSWPAVCQLTESNILICGGTLKGKTETETCHIYNISSKALSTIPNKSNLSGNTGCVLYSNCCYFFGGYINSFSYRESSLLCLNKNEWRSICSLPVNSSVFNPVVQDNFIYLTGYHIEDIIYYSPEYDRYYQYTYRWNLARFKSLFKHKNQIYLIYDTRIFLIYQEGCKEICSYGFDYNKPIIKSTENEAYAIFHNGSAVYRFSPFEKRVELVYRFKVGRGNNR